MPLLFLEPLPRRTNVAAVVALLERVGQIDRRRIGRIELRGQQAIVQVPEGWQARLVKALDGAALDDRRLRAGILPDADSSFGRGLETSTEEHFIRLARLLEIESQAEAQRAADYGRRLSRDEAQQTGNCLLDLAVIDEDTGLGGRFLLRLARRKRDRLPWTRLEVGTPVVLTPDVAKAAEGSRGVVYHRSETTIGVALSSLPDDVDGRHSWRLDLSHDEAAQLRQRAALERAKVSSGDRLAQLRDVLRGLQAPAFRDPLDEPPLDPQLNGSQREAVQWALSAEDVALIHGPPGTGKTRAVVEVIRRAVRQGRKVLACAPSNLAVDNLFERLLAFGEKAVRLGHPARVLPELREHTLDELVERHPDVRLARKLVKEALGLFRKADRYTRATPPPGQRRETREEARALLADARRLEFQAAEHILDQADILCATTTRLDSEILGPRRFHLAVIDEACQSTEPGCWIPLLRTEAVVLAGDHCQLPPTVVSPEAAHEGFGVSLFERLAERYDGQIARMLNVQYRMHAQIADVSSREFYGGQLAADASVAGHLLADLPGVARTALSEMPVEFIDTAGAGFDEQQEPDGESRLNPPEADLVVRKAEALLALGLPAADIAVIAPYAAQVRLLRQKIAVPGLEIDTVDGFQGREKEAVVISLVRSNPQGEIGFLADVRRMNVAITRARRKLLVVGDSATLASHPFYERLLEYFERAGAYRTVWDEDGGP